MKDYDDSSIYQEGSTGNWSAEKSELGVACYTAIDLSTEALVDLKEIDETQEADNYSWKWC